MAARHYASLLDLDAWFRARAPAYAAIGYPDDNVVQLLRDGMAGKLTNAQLDALVGHIVERFRASGNHAAQIGDVEWRRIAQDLCVAEFEALSRGVERDEGQFSGTPDHPLLRDHVEPDFHDAVDLLALWDDYVASRQKVGSMATGGKRQRLAVTSLIEILGHQDAARLEKRDLIRWRDECLSRVSASTVSSVYIPTVRSLFRWAVENDRMKSNPASDIKQAKPKIIRTRELGFTDEEALKLLKAQRATRLFWDRAERCWKTSRRRRRSAWSRCCAPSPARVSVRSPSCAMRMFGAMRRQLSSVSARRRDPSRRANIGMSHYIRRCWKLGSWSM